jgi:hypothetical protein
MFRFTIRDVLWLMVVVALGVSLWLQSRQIAQLRLLRQDLDDAVGIIQTYAAELDEVAPGRRHMVRVEPGYDGLPGPYHVPIAIPGRLQAELDRRRQQAEASSANRQPQ